MKSAAELLDVDRINACLKRELPDLSGTPTVRVLSGGSSNITCALDYPDRSLVLRRPPPGRKARGAHDMVREAKIIAGLRPQFEAVPEVYAVIDDPEVMDAPFFVMEMLEGQIIYGDADEATIGGPDGAATLCDAFAATWVALHAVDVTRPELAWLNRGTGYVERQVGGWTRRYRDARTPDAGSFEEVMAWLAKRQPEDQGSCLIHNDYRIDNMVFDRHDRSRIVGVLDWELATVGCPLMDLGGSLAYWVEAGDDAAFRSLKLQPTHLPGFWTREELVARYEALSGRRVDDLDFYLVFGLFRLAGIAQQIYYRHYHGQFESDHFARFGPVVNYLEERCLRIMRGSNRA